jgi:hypothetical protein
LIEDSYRAFQDFHWIARRAQRNTSIVEHHDANAPLPLDEETSRFQDRFMTAKAHSASRSFALSTGHVPPAPNISMRKDDHGKGAMRSL